jgi:hypothetical protein
VASSNRIVANRPGENRELRGRHDARDIFAFSLEMDREVLVPEHIAVSLESLTCIQRPILSRQSYDRGDLRPVAKLSVKSGWTMRC